MTKLKHVLLVTNAVSETEVASVKNALKHAEQNGTTIKLSLVHVIPNLPTCYFNIPSMVMLAERYYEEAKTYLSSIGQILTIAKENQWLITGRMKNETLRLAEKIDADFILASSSNIQDFHQTLKIKSEKETTMKPIHPVFAI